MRRIQTPRSAGLRDEKQQSLTHDTHAAMTLALLFSGASLLQACSRYVALPWLARRHRQALLEPCLLVVTAHPDDETLFFAPALVEGRTHVLCLSDGGYDGLGATRTRELAVAAHMLGISAEVASHPDLPDSPSVRWRAKTVSDAVRTCIKRRRQPVTALLTFDEQGVTQHINHIDTARGVCTPASGAPVFALVTVPWWLRFAGPFAAVLVALAALASARVRTWSTARPGDRVVCVSRDFGRRAAQCMKAAHVSQLTWFRRLYVATSAYLYVCVFVRVV